MERKHTSHFLYPVFLSFDFGADLLAILGSLFLTYSCASAAHTFLCVLKCAFWQSLPQYGVVWHLLQALREESTLPHCAQASGAALVEAVARGSGGVSWVVVMIGVARYRSKKVMRRS